MLKRLTIGALVLAIISLAVPYALSWIAPDARWARDAERWHPASVLVVRLTECGSRARYDFFGVWGYEQADDADARFRRARRCLWIARALPVPSAETRMGRDYEWGWILFHERRGVAALALFEDLSDLPPQYRMEWYHAVMPIQAGWVVVGELQPEAQIDYAHQAHGLLSGEAFRQRFRQTRCDTYFEPELFLSLATETTRVWSIEAHIAAADAAEAALALDSIVVPASASGQEDAGAWFARYTAWTDARIAILRGDLAARDAAYDRLLLAYAHQPYGINYPSVALQGVELPTRFEFLDMLDQAGRCEGVDVMIELEFPFWNDDLTWFETNLGEGPTVRDDFDYASEACFWSQKTSYTYQAEICSIRDRLYAEILAGPMVVSEWGPLGPLPDRTPVLACYARDQLVARGLRAE